jgi:predicted phosphate transport protein (TIGR00153 family)
MTVPVSRRPHQDERFFFLFSQLAAKAVQTARRFQTLVARYEDLEQGVADIRLFEHEADVLVHELESRLNAAIVTPFDREDMHSLTGRLDDVVDHIEASADRLLLFNVPQPTDHLKRLADALTRCTLEVELAVEAFIRQNRDGLLHHCHLINEIENEADQVLRDALRTLFSGAVEPLEVIKWKDIYDLIEQATDACEDVADVLETAAIKNA